MNSYKLFAVGIVFAVMFVGFAVITAPTSAFADDGEWGYYGDSGDYGCYDSCYGDYGDYGDGCYDSCYGDYDGDGCHDSCYDDTGCYDSCYDDYGCYDGCYDDVYYDDGCSCYSYGSSGGSKSFSMPSFSSSGFSMVKPMTFSAPSYPVYNPPHTSSSVSNVTNTSITNIDNSISDSFNNYNSGIIYGNQVTGYGNTAVAVIGTATEQYPVVYTQPAPYCQLYQASAASGYGVNAAYLSWTSSNATSAYLSNVGSVNVNGSSTVWPGSSMTYTLTVYGANGQQATCYTTVTGYSAPYVSLTQIPYTGFDFGTLGNAMYWTGLVLFALGAGYLAVYYLPRLAVGKAGVPSLALAGVRTKSQFAPIVADKAPILAESEIVEAKVAPIANQIAGQIRKAGTNDTMAIFASKDGSMPKIVIDRS